MFARDAPTAWIRFALEARSERPREKESGRTRSGGSVSPRAAQSGARGVNGASFVLNLVEELKRSMPVGWRDDPRPCHTWLNLYP